MSVYLPTVEWDTPNTRARCSGPARAVTASRSTRSRRMRSKLTQVAHQRQSHPVTPLASPWVTVHQLRRDHFTEAEGRSVRLAGARLTSQVLVQARPGRQAAIGKLTNPGTVAQSMSVPAATIRAMRDDIEQLPTTSSAAAWYALGSSCGLRQGPSCGS
jgi:hypothetical protein